MLETEDDTVTNKSQGIGGRPLVSQEIHLTLDISGYHDSRWEITDQNGGVHKTIIYTLWL